MSVPLGIRYEKKESDLSDCDILLILLTRLSEISKLYNPGHVQCHGMKWMSTLLSFDICKLVPLGRVVEPFSWFASISTLMLQRVGKPAATREEREENLDEQPDMFHASCFSWFRFFILNIDFSCESFYPFCANLG